MSDYLIFEAKDQRQAHYYSPQFHLYLAEVGAQIDCPTPYAAMMNHLRRRSCPEDQRLLELRTRGRSISDCARMLGRSYGSARTRLLTLAAHESYREDQL